MKNRNVFKLALSLLIANAIRLLRIIPNNDPIMSMALPYSKRSAAITSFLFPFITMASFDMVTNAVGPWTAVTSVTYGLLGLAFHYVLRGREKVGMKSYLGYGVAGVLVFDFITGVLATPFLFGMPVWQALVGQIPFTAMHLLTTVGFIIIVTPLLDREVLRNERLNDSRVRSFIFSLAYR